MANVTYIEADGTPHVIDVAIGVKVMRGALNRDLTLANWFGSGIGVALADGPTVAHRSQLAWAYLKTARTAAGMFPSEHIPTRRAAALARYPEAQ